MKTVICNDYAKRLLKAGKLIQRGHVTIEGRRWLVLDRMDLQITQHTRAFNMATR
jgi:hypothetical protein